MGNGVVISVQQQRLQGSAARLHSIRKNFTDTVFLRLRQRKCSLQCIILLFYFSGYAESVSCSVVFSPVQLSSVLFSPVQSCSLLFSPGAAFLNCFYSLVLSTYSFNSKLQ